MSDLGAPPEETTVSASDFNFKPDTNPRISHDQGEDTDVDSKGLPISFSGVFNTAVTADNVPTVLSKLQKWGDYESYGTPVGPSLFIPMKTPLSPTFLTGFGVSNGASYGSSESSKIKTTCEKVPHIHTLPKFLDEQKVKGVEVGLVIDLSNHDCLYLDGITEHIQRVHVRNVAKSIPDVKSVNEVISVAENFWRENKTKHVAVHCAYGFNRTGFVLCCYLIEKCGLSAAEALAAFAEARSPGVKHERFRDALQRRYPTPGCSPVADVDLIDGDINDAGKSISPNQGFDTLEGELNPGNTPGKENETLDLDISVLDVSGGREEG